MNLSLVYVISFLLLTNLTNYVQPARFIRNAQTLACLDITLPTSPSSCAPVTLNPCPVDRFSEFPDSLKWNLIPVNTTTPLIDNSTITIESNNTQLCLSTSSSNNVEACPCDNGVAQRWILNVDKILSAAKPNGCLSLVREVVNVGTCQVNGGPASWKSYHVAPNAVNLYLKSGFAGNPQQLFVNDYNSKFLPPEIFSTPFSLEIPPGYEFIIDSGNNDIKTFDSDVSQMSPISSLTSIVSVKLKSGMIIYEYPAYFSASKFIKVGDQIPSSSIIGSVLIPEGLRGIIWSNSNFTGDNLGLFESIANFTGVSVATKQDFAASLDISSTKCKNECGSGGFCSDDGACKCKPNFTGERCEQCLPGFFGPTCQKCQCTTVLNKNKCDDTITGTGDCSCNDGFTGENCDKCVPGFILSGNKCIECNCGSGGVCNAQGTACICNAGFVSDPNTKLCTCKEGYFKSGTECKPCTPGCKQCDPNGICSECQPGFQVDGSGKCIQDPNIPAPTSCIDPFCEICSENTQVCLQCKSPTLNLEGNCVTPDTIGKCLLDQAATANQSFVADNTQQICQPCPSTCLDCSIQGFNTASTFENMQCTLCIPGYFLNNGECVKDCPAKKYADFNSCKDCDQSCESCKGPQNNECIKCSNKVFFNFNGTCSSKCPPGFAAIDNTCKKCHADCSECSGPEINQCTKCPPNRPILTKDGQCVEACPKGTYADENDKCQKCNEDCSSCVGPKNDQCLGCNDQTKVLLGGACSGSCPSGSELIKVEKLCQSLNGEDIIPPGEVIKEQKQTQSDTPIRLQWWHILIIAAGSLLILILVALLIRCIAVKRRKKKTKDFGDQIDENTVAQNLKNMLRNARGMPTQPEMSHSSMKTQEVDVPNASLPAYDHKEGELYWKSKQQRHQKHMSITTDDYNKWKQNLKSKDWEGFDIVTEESMSSNSSNDAGYSGGEKSTYEAPKGNENIYRNSKGSLRSNRPISTKRTFDVPIRRDSWGENWI